MGRMSEVGRGTYTHIGGTDEVNARMTELLDRLTRPAVTDLRVRLTGSRAEITPEQLPDLYAGEPLILLARGDSLAGTLEVSGRIGGREWSRSVPLAEAVAGPGVAKLWARRRIMEIEVARPLGRWRITPLPAPSPGSASISRWSAAKPTWSRSTVRRPAAGRALTREEIPLNLPPAGTSTPCSTATMRT
jgi:Ca-activated chloride channel family protein